MSDREDAERYRFIRDHRSDLSSLFAEREFRGGLWVRMGSQYVGDTLDEKVDKARGMAIVERAANSANAKDGDGQQ